MHDDVKAFRTYEEQVDLLAGRGMGQQASGPADLSTYCQNRCSGVAL